MWEDKATTDPTKRFSEATGGHGQEEIINKKYFFDLFNPGEKEQLKQGALGAFARKENFRNFINVSFF